MKRRGKNPNENPGVKPPVQVELSEKHVGKRTVLIIVLIVLAVVGIAVAIASALSQDDGWTTITADASNEANCSADFIFQYEIGRGGTSATAEHKKVTRLYTEACRDAYRIFHADAAFEDVHNPYYINRHVGEEITVPDVLYRMFELFDRTGNRLLYAAPMYTDYRNLFTVESDAATKDFDPYTNAEVAAYLREVATYVCDPGAVRVELLGEGKIRLLVSDAYRAFAAENGITSYIDLYWMKNAFIADYLADTLAAAGYTAGNLTSFDGYARNLDDSGLGYSVDLFDHRGGKTYAAARLDYTGAKSMVFLRAYSISAYDETYYTFADGTVRHAYLDVTDGLCKNALENLFAYSESLGCAETLLHIAPAFIADTFDVTRLDAAERAGVHSVFFEGTTLIAYDRNVTFSRLFEDESGKYTVTYREAE